MAENGGDESNCYEQDARRDVDRNGAMGGRAS